MASIQKQKISSNLWFDGQAEEAANYYVSIFRNSRIRRISHYTQEGFEIHKHPAGSVLTVEFELEGIPFMALNGGPKFKFNEAISFVIHCKSQKDIDYYWQELAQGGDPSAQQCGWLKDKYGVSWQIVPSALADMMGDPDEEKVSRVMKVMLKMKKLELDELTKAYKEKSPELHPA